MTPTLNGADHHPDVSQPKDVGLDMSAVDVYRLGACTVFVGKEPDSDRWHLAMTHPKRRPTLEELAAARLRYIPEGVRMVLILPDGNGRTPLHLWEVRGEA
jgi:hypothetical protein